MRTLTGRSRSRQHAPIKHQSSQAPSLTTSTNTHTSPAHYARHYEALRGVPEPLCLYNVKHLIHAHKRNSRSIVEAHMPSACTHTHTQTHTNTHTNLALLQHRNIRTTKNIPTDYIVLIKAHSSRIIQTPCERKPLK